MQSDNGNENKGTRRNNLIIPLLIILCLMVAMVIYTSRIINRVSVANIQEVGEDKISGVTAQLENYLDRAKSVLWVTADTVDHMVHNGGTSEQILHYIVEETERQKQQFDENYTGIYGYIMGEYLDGLNWVPPEGYDPLRPVRGRPLHRRLREAGRGGVASQPLVRRREGGRGPAAKTGSLSPLPRPL